MVSYLVIPRKTIFERFKMKDSLLGKAAMLYVKFQIWMFGFIVFLAIISALIETK